MQFFGRPLRVLRLASLLLLPSLLWGLPGCATKKRIDNRHQVLISVDEQQMLLLRDQQPIRTFRVSTSRFGLGDRPGSNCTPLGQMRVEDKIGDRQPSGMVFKGRRPTGEILAPNAPGRDPIVSRIIWLRGMEQQNRNAYGRYIYIHGTPQEAYLGAPASFGCVRMASKDVIELYNIIGEGARVDIIRGSLPHHRGAFGRWSTTRGDNAAAGRLAMQQDAHTADSQAAAAASASQLAAQSAQPAEQPAAANAPNALRAGPPDRPVAGVANSNAEGAQPSNTTVAFVHSQDNERR